MTDEEIRTERVVLGDLYFNDKLTCIHWLVRHRLLKNSCFCRNCDIPMSFVKKKSVADGYRWQCKRCRCGSSIKSNSFFALSHLLLNKIIIIIYCWCYGVRQSNIVRKAGLRAHSRHTIIEWGDFCRDICEQDATVLGGYDEWRNQYQNESMFAEFIIAISRQFNFG